MTTANPTPGRKEEMARKLALYCQTPESRDYLTGIIQSSPASVLAETRTLDNLPHHVNSGAHAILLEYLEGHPYLDQWIKRIAADPKNPAIFLYCHQISTDQLWKALRLGVKECFSYPIRPEEFQEALERLQVVPLAPDQVETTRLITVLGCKGGVGATFVTVNLAYLLAQESHGQVLLVDLDLRYGQMVHFLDAKPKYTLMDVIDNADHLEPAYLMSLLCPCEDRLFLLPAPARLEEVEAVTPEHLEKVLRLIKGLGIFRYLVVDAGRQLDETNLKALDLSDKVILVTAPSIPALSNTKKLLDLMQLIGLDCLDLEVWLNIWQKHGDLTLRDISTFLGRQVEVAVPTDQEAVARSINEGQLLVKSAARSPVSRELKALAGRLVEPEANGHKAGGGFWLKLWGRKK